MYRRALLWGLWICTFLILAIAAFQSLSGHWVAFFLVWPGFRSLQQILGLLTSLASLHRVFGFTTGALSLVILALAFSCRASVLVRVLAAAGFVIVFVTVLGGYLYVTSGLTDRWGLGQMADASVGVFVAYFMQLIFMTRQSRFPWAH